MALKDNEKDTAIACTSVAVKLLRDEQEKLRNNGIRMSLGAIASKAIVDQLKKE